jgi:predicted transport protein
MNRNIDLIRYKRFGEDLILLEQLTSTTSTTVAKPPANATGGGQWVKGKYKTVSECIAEAPPHLRDLYEALKAYCEALGDDVAVKTTEYYVAFRRMKNFITVELKNQAGKILVYAKVDPGTVAPNKGFLRDVTKIGHFGTGNLEITIANAADLEMAKPLIERAYNEA